MAELTTGDKIKALYAMEKYLGTIDYFIFGLKNVIAGTDENDSHIENDIERLKNLEEIKDLLEKMQVIMKPTK